MKRVLFPVLLVCGIMIGGLLHFSSRVAADPDEKKLWPAFECRWTNKPIKVDGRADEEAWQRAQVIDNFVLHWQKDRPAKTATRARLLWDDEYLYFFADMVDSDLFANVTEHDGVTWNNDVFELFFKPRADQPGYYELQVNAANTVMDMFLPSRGSGGYERWKAAHEFHIQSKVVLRGTLNRYQDADGGWSVEGRVPWKDFSHTGGKPAAGAEWKMNLCRYDYSTAFEYPELSTCSPLSRPDFHKYEEYATVKFVK